MKNRIARLLAATLVILSVTGCAWWQKDVKPIVSTVDDIARSMCAMFYGERMGVSPEEALKTYCKLREQWAPWIDPALASMQAGGSAKLGAAVPAPAATGIPADGNPPYLPSAPAQPAPTPTPQPPAEGAPAPESGGGK